MINSKHKIYFSRVSIRSRDEFERLIKMFIIIIIIIINFLFEFG